MWNYRALIKVSILVGLILIGAILHFPITKVTVLYVKDIRDFQNNTTMWYSLPPGGKTIYIIAPIAVFLLVGAYYYLQTRKHNKNIFINGSLEGKVKFIYGYRKWGHIYDLTCIFMNKGKHFDKWEDFPRPISKQFAQNKIVIYYKPRWFIWPTIYHRVIIEEQLLSNRIYTVVLNGKYNYRLYDPKTPEMSYIRLTDQPLQFPSALQSEPFDKQSEITRKDILRNTWSMIRAEPGTAAIITRKSSYAVSDRTMNKAFDALPEKTKGEIEKKWGVTNATRTEGAKAQPKS